MISTNYLREKPLALVADDELSWRLSMCAALNKAGFDVIEAENGREALAFFQSDKPDLVLLDILMPEMDGFETCAAIRNLPGGQYVQILMVTGLDDTDSIERAFEVGANDFVAKPLNWVMLGHRAKYMLRAGLAFQELNRSKRRLAKTQELARLGNWEIDLINNTLHCSPEAQHLLGLLGDRQVTYKDFLASVISQEQTKVKEKIDTAIKTNSSFSIHYRVILPDETERHILNRGEIFFNENGVAEILLGAVQDVTQVKRAEEEKINMQERLFRASKMEAIGLMAAGVAHDLNNILSGIVGYPELLLQKLPKDSEMRKPIKAILESGKRAATIVADLLTVARGAASTREVHNLNDLVQEYLNSPECKKLKSFYPNITCQHQFTATQHSILCSSVHVKKCLMNLVTNAAEAIVGRGSVVVFTENQYIDDAASAEHNLKAGEYVVLGVRDTGPGIAKTDVEHIFEPFYTKKIMGRSGTGLGLTVAWNTMEDHKGKIFVETSDKGTCFQLYFPVHIKKGVVQPKKDKVEKLIGNSEHILVVDDEPQLRDIASQMLRIMGYKVDSVCSGELAVEFVKNNPVELIIIDMLMEPGMNGRQTYEEIIKLYPDQKAIIVSGFTESDDVKETIKLGAGGFIKKPYSINELSRVIKETLNR